MSRIIITCQAIDLMNEYSDSCCGSCHEDAEEDYYSGWMCQSYPPKTNLAYETVMSDLCCAKAGVVNNWTRDDWARAVWIQRKINRGE